MKVYFVSLGCPKNLTDTEVLMGKLTAAGHTITIQPSEADMIIINTCSFLKTARNEALATIKEMAKWKKKGKCKKLYIAGCLPKYPSPSCLPAGKVGNWTLDIDGVIDSIGLFDYCTPRKATPPWTAYVKIAEGCNNCCSYCLVPSIRGKLRLRKIGDIIKEVEILAKKGVKEVIFIAQDTTAHPDLPEILHKAARIRGIRWLRIMYAHPAHVTDKLIAVMAKERKIVKYLDLPIQHAHAKILRLMKRRYDGPDLENLISKIRRQIPKIALRTSVIVGFPGEGEAEFQELLNFIRKEKFARLGCFTYQKEEGTPASKMREQVSEKIKIERANKIMRAQGRVSRELNRKLVGQTLNILIEKAIKDGFRGRSVMDAPEIDGSVFVSSSKTLKPGEIVSARVTGARTYDLFGLVT